MSHTARRTDPPHDDPDSLRGGSPVRFSQDELDRLGPFGVREELAAQDAIFAAGEPGDSMFLISSGSVEISFPRVKQHKLLGVGEFFGELALIRGEHHRTASALAADDCTLYRLSPDAFRELQSREPELMTHLLRVTCAYLVDSEQSLIEDLRRRNRELERTVEFLRRTQEALGTQELLAQTDELTGLYNRRCLNLQVEQLLLPQEQPDGCLALLLIDIDRFKWINDQRGHMMGDRVLQTFAERLRAAVRAADLPCRIGGDEFAVLLPHVAVGDALARARHLHREVGRFEVTTPDGELKITTSMGGGVHRADEPWEQFLERVDADLYRAKATGIGRMAWQGELRDACDAG